MAQSKSKVPNFGCRQVLGAVFSPLFVTCSILIWGGLLLYLPESQKVLQYSRSLLHLNKATYDGYINILTYILFGISFFVWVLTLFCEFLREYYKMVFRSGRLEKRNDLNSLVYVLAIIVVLLIFPALCAMFTGCVLVFIVLYGLVYGGQKVVDNFASISNAANLTITGVNALLGSLNALGTANETVRQMFFGHLADAAANFTAATEGNPAFLANRTLYDQAADVFFRGVFRDVADYYQNVTFYTNSTCADATCINLGRFAWINSDRCICGEELVAFVNDGTVARQAALLAGFGIIICLYGLLLLGMEVSRVYGYFSAIKFMSKQIHQGKYTYAGEPGALISDEAPLSKSKVEY